MAYLIGMDEAGYGPNLGPLVISTTVWRVRGDARRADLYRLLAEVVTAGGPDEAPDGERNGQADDRLVIADSKSVYQPATGLGCLERGVLAAVAALGLDAWTWSTIWQRLAPASAAELAAEPWHQNFALDLPLANRATAIRKAGRRLRMAARAAGVQLVGLYSRAVFPSRFNRLVAQWGNKATVLSHTSLGLLAEVVASLDDEPVLALCDKHGGRSTYGRLLQQHFPDWLVECYGESRSASTYRFGPRQRRTEVRFLVRGETELPIALASMVSKYLRELAMRAFNDFWQARVPQLRPTAGYPSDSRRFKREIAQQQAALALADDVLWRAQ